MLKILSTFLLVFAILSAAVVAVPEVTLESPIALQYIEVDGLFPSIFFTAVLYELIISVTAIVSGSALALTILFFLALAGLESVNDISGRVGGVCGFLSSFVMAILVFALGDNVISFAPSIPFWWAVTLGITSRLFIVVLAAQ